jgi:hypothetical protein
LLFNTHPPTPSLKGGGKVKKGLRPLPRFFKKEIKNMKVVILAGGFGTRITEES